MQMENIWIKKWDQQQEEFFVNQKEHHQVSSKLPTHFYGENVIFLRQQMSYRFTFSKKNRVSTGLVPLGVIFQAKILKMKKILWTSKTTWIEEKLATTEHYPGRTKWSGKIDPWIPEGNYGSSLNLKLEFLKPINKLFEPRMVQFIFQTRYSDNGFFKNFFVRTHSTSNQTIRLDNYRGQTVWVISYESSHITQLERSSMFTTEKFESCLQALRLNHWG